MPRATVLPQKILGWAGVCTMKTRKIEIDLASSVEFLFIWNSMVY
jgi:hypothetical protein